MSHVARLFPLLALVWSLVGIQPGLCTPPVVTEAKPDNGAVDVDPSLDELRIVFDQPMSAGGFSVVGGGDSFPEIQGKPRWENPTTLVMRVKLQPNHAYWLSINSDRFQNFKNRKGEPAVPYPISFRTGSADGKRYQPREGETDSSATLTPTQNKRAVNLLRTALLKNYSHRDRLGINWGGVLSKQRTALIAAKSPQEFAEIAAVMLAQARDKHIWLQVGIQHVPTFVSPQVPNVNFKLLPQVVSDWKVHNQTVSSGRLSEEIAYLWIGSWGADRADDLQAAFDFLQESKDTRAVVIDMRGNGGGSEPLAQKLAGIFVDHPAVYAEHISVDPEKPGKFLPPSQRVLQPNKEQPHYRGRVVVLTGPVVMSSCEAFLLMMRQDPQAVLVGAASQGSSGNPQPYDLENGVTVFLPSWKAMKPDGEELEGKGVAPDVVVDAVPKDFESADPVIEAALKVLNREMSPR
jgi:hypothetical protein